MARIFSILNTGFGQYKNRVSYASVAICYTNSVSNALNKVLALYKGI